MSIRPPDILSIAQIATYVPTTPYTAIGDNTPFNSIDSRHDWFTQMTAKDSLFTVGKSASSSITSGTVVALNVNTNNITPATTAMSAFASDEIPAVVATIVGTGSGSEKYLVDSTYHYFCVIHSKAIDIPSASFVATGAEVGCPVYYNFTSEKFEYIPLGTTTSPTGDLIENYKGKKIPLGNIVAIFTYSAKEYYTIKFGSQEGMGVGLDMSANSIGDLYHSSLSDIISEKSNKPSTYNANHYLYSNKFISPTIGIPTFQASTGLSGVVDNTGHTYTITDTAITSGLVNNCRLWSIPVYTDTVSGIISIYISDSVTGTIVSNTFVVSGEATTTDDIVVDIVSNSEIKFTVNSSSVLADPQEDPVLYYFVNDNSYFLRTIATSSEAITPTEASNVVEFSITSTDIQGASGEHLKGTQLIIGNTKTTSGGDEYYGTLIYWYDPDTSQWSEVLSGNCKFYQDSVNTEIDYLATSVATSSPFSFSLTGQVGSTLTMESLDFITYITPDLGLEIGKLLEYVPVSGLGYYQLSRNEVSGQPLGIITEHVSTYATPYTVYLLAEGIWSKETTGASGTIGGMGEDLVIDSAITYGDDLWDNGDSGSNYGHLTPTMPTDMTRQKRIGFCIDSNAYLITIYNNNDFKPYLDEIQPDTVTINDATIQIYPKWARTGLVYDVSGNLGVTPFDTRRIATNATISIQPVAIDASGSIWLNLNERCPQTMFSGGANNTRVSGAETRIANCNATFWSSVSGTLASINFDDTNKVLEIVAGTNTILNPFDSVYLGKQVTSDFYTLDSYLKYDEGVDNTQPTTAQLGTLVPGPFFKHSLPYSGVMILAHTDTNTAGNNKLMLFSYHGYSGYGTNKLAFYNVNIYKKVDADGSTFMASNWIGSDPGYYPKDYYNPESAYYGKYLTLKKPNWSTTSPGLWGSTNSSGWSFKLLYGGGVCLKVIGKGVFDTIQLLPADRTLNTHLGCMKVKSPLASARATHASKFDNHNAALADNSAKSLWASQNTALSLPTFVQSALASTYQNIDFYTDSTTVISYSDVQGYADMLGAIGAPNRATTSSNGATYLSGSPTVFWVDPKEIWCDVYVGSVGIYDVMSSFIKVSSVTYDDYSDTIDDNSMIEFTLGQTLYSDPEEPFLSMDNALIGYNEFVDLMDGEAVRFYLNNRKVSW